MHFIYILVKISSSSSFSSYIFLFCLTFIVYFYFQSFQTSSSIELPFKCSKWAKIQLLINKWIQKKKKKEEAKL